MEKKFWLMKSEPSVFSIDDLRESPRKTTGWNSIRNYQARNFMRDDMKKGDGVLFYHSNAKPPAVVGIARVVREAYPDTEQFKSTSKYFDPKSDENNPRWIQVDIQLEKKFSSPVTLENIKKNKPLSKMLLIKRGMRLSIQPVTQSEWKMVLKMGDT